MAIPVSNEELERRIRDLQEAGMTLAARTLLKELNFRMRDA